jgi:uncharacterized delta-60 repeat protein
MTKIFRILFAFLTLFSAHTITNAQCVPVSTAAGALDSCFDGDGRVTTQVSAGIDFANAVVIQPDGKIVVAGVADRENASSDSKFGLVRYNADGSLDTTFDGDGIVITNFVVGNLTREDARSIALQPDGKIVVAGYAELNTNNFAFALVRYNVNGSLDTSFDGDGKAVFDIAGNIDEANGVVIQPDGKIVVAGDSRSDRVYSIVARFNSNGSLDNTFDTDGWVVIDAMSNTNAVGFQRDGRIIVAGETSSHRMAVACLNTNGSLNPFFGFGGIAVTSTTNSTDEALAMSVRLDDNIFAGGVANSGGSDCPPIARFRTDGDVSVLTTICDGGFYAMTNQTDLKLLTAGESWNPTWGFTVKRFIDANQIDTSFGGSGRVPIQFTPGNPAEFSFARGIATQRDNKIVVAGVTFANIQSPTSKFAVARLYSGLLAPHAERFDFDGDGKADVSVFRPSENRWYVFRSSDSGVTEQFFGMNGMRPVPADFDGDGKTDFAVFGNFTGYGSWFYLSSATGGEVSLGWGLGGDIPRVSDFNGDGRADFILFRPGENFWYRYSATGEFSNQPFGLSGDKPVAGDFDGDGKSDKAIYRPSTGDWWWQSSLDNVQRATRWGISTDIPAAGDYDGDGKTDFAVYRPETGVWYIINSSNFSFTILNFGLAEDKPVPADYDGDGKVDIAVFRPSTGVWYLLRSTAGFAAMQFGVSTDVPVPNAYIQ